MPPFVLVDGSYFLFRAFHAVPPLTTSTGLQTNAVRGAISAIQKLMRRIQSTHMVVILIHQNQHSDMNFHLFIKVIVQVCQTNYLNKFHTYMHLFVL